MGPLELRGLLDRRFFQHQHVDDLVLNGRRRPVVVAVVAVRLDRLHHRRMLRLPDGTYWCAISHRIPRREPCLLWHLGLSLASFQQSCHGLYLVRRSVLHRREVCLFDDSGDLEELGRFLAHPRLTHVEMLIICIVGSHHYPKHISRGFWHNHGGLGQLFHLLACLTPCHLVSSPQDPTPIHSQGLFRALRRNSLPYLGHRPRRWHRPYCSSACDDIWVSPGMGVCHRRHVGHC